MKNILLYSFLSYIVLTGLLGCKRDPLGDQHPAKRIRELRNETDYTVRIKVYDSARVKEDILIFPGRSDSAVDYSCTWYLRGGVNCYGNLYWHEWADSIHLYFDDKKYIRYCYDFITPELACGDVDGYKNIMIVHGYETRFIDPIVLEDPVIHHKLYVITEEDYAIAKDL